MSRQYQRKQQRRRQRQRQHQQRQRIQLFCVTVSFYLADTVRASTILENVREAARAKKVRAIN